jgi:hypothetical protein
MVAEPDWHNNPWDHISETWRGWRPIKTAPTDGRTVLLKPKHTPEGFEVRGFWKESPEMKAGGFWSTMEGRYITPWPEWWAPLSAHAVYDDANDEDASSVPDVPKR